MADPKDKDAKADASADPKDAPAGADLPVGAGTDPGENETVEVGADAPAQGDSPVGLRPEDVPPAVVEIDGKLHQVKQHYTQQT